MGLCQVCGNEITRGQLVCPFCGSKQAPEQLTGSPGKQFRTRTVNIERGMPLADDALSHLATALIDARSFGINVLTVIHGYGSSGHGGIIRSECRKKLDYMCSRGELNGYLPGEQFNRRKGRTKDLLRRFPQLASDKNLDKNNRGVTLVIL